MKKVIVLALFVASIGGIFLATRLRSEAPLPTNMPAPSLEQETVDITASFIIKTDSITRSFKAEKYLNKSPDVFITAADPTKIYVKKKGITWDDFFATLPMKLTKECLTTGDGETLCSGKNETLKFYLNDIEDKDLLDKEIRQDDTTLIEFVSR